MADPSSAGRDIYSVSRLNAEARAVLEGSFPLLCVEGEISNLASPRSGHLYFSLKDAVAQVRCALFRGKRQLLRFSPANGDKVLARVRISFYEPRGEFQLLVEHLEPAGAGEAQRLFEALKQKLQAEGLFDSTLKRPLPAFPVRLGVITSPSGAAIRDVLNVLRRRAPHIAVTLYPAQVQGQNAVDEIREALAIALARADCDVLLLTRGGGSAEDLAAFNDEGLARDIAAASIPVVSAIGHEIDFTIADFIADRRAPTPSAAAELISPDSEALLANLDGQTQRLQRGLRRRLYDDAATLRGLRGRLGRLAPATRLRQQQQRLDDLDLRLARNLKTRLDAAEARVQATLGRLRSQSPSARLRAVSQRFERLPSRLRSAMQSLVRQRSERLGGLARELHAVSPLATMQRGYSVLRTPDEHGVISSVGAVTRGDRLEALLSDGTIELEALQVDKRGLADTDD